MKVRLTLAAVLLLTVMAGLHLLYAVGASAHMRTAFIDRGPDMRAIGDNFPLNDPRIIARYVSMESATDLMGLYAKQALGNDARTQILIAGSSVAYGHAVQQEASLSGAMNRAFDRSIGIANVSVLGYDVRSVGIDLCKLVAHDIKPDVIILEIPIINEISALNSKNPPNEQWFKDGQCPSDAAEVSESYLSYFLKHPWGAHAPSMLATSFDDRPGNVMVNPSQAPPTTYSFTAEDIGSKTESAKTRLMKLVSIAEYFDAKIVMMGTPVYRPAFDRADLDGMLDAYEVIWMEVCQSAGAVCIDPSAGLEQVPEYFFNLSHLNRRGGEVFVLEIIAALESAGVDLPERVAFEEAAAPLLRKPDNTIDLDGIFPSLAAKYFINDPASGPRNVVYFRPSQGTVAMLESDGLRANRWTYGLNEEGVATFTFIRRYGDGRKQERLTGLIEITETGWVESHTADTAILPAVATVTLRSDGTLVRESDGTFQLYKPVDRAVIPTL